MPIHESKIYSSKNLGGEIRIDIAHCVSRPSNGRSRPIVVRFVTRKGRDMVLQQSSKLKGTRWSIGEQLPSSMCERRSAMVKEMINMKKENDQLKIKVTKDKMYINQAEAPSLFEINPLPQPSADLPVRKYKDMSHTSVKHINGSSFQGHAAMIHSLDEAAQAREALFLDPYVSKADSTMYAYRFMNENLDIVRGFSDDREWLGGGTLHKLLEENNDDNVFVAVSRHHKGPNLGIARFAHIKEAAKSAIDLELLKPVEGVLREEEGLENADGIVSE